MNIIEYTALKYYNSCVSEECLYVGMLFNNLTTNTRVFKSIKNYKRLESFDDEVSIEFFKDYLYAIKTEVEDNIFNYYKVFNLREYVKPYVNELRFSTIKTEKTDDPEFIDNMAKLFLKFDYDKKQRLSKEIEKKYIKRVLKSSNIDYSEKPITGKYNEHIRFDVVTESYGIKFFKFEGRDLPRLINNAKTWAFNAREMKEDKKIVFLYDMDFKNSEIFDIIMEILREDAFKVMPYETGIEYITTNIG